MHIEGGGVQISWADVGTVRLQLARIPEQHQEGKAGLGAAREVSTEGGGGADILGNFLPFVSSVSALF